MILTIALAANSPERNALALGARQQIAQSRDGRIAAIRADDDARGESFPHDVDLPIFRSGSIEGNHRCFLANLSADRARALKKKVVEKAALDTDHAVVASRKMGAQFLAADGDEFYGVEHTMRPT